MLVCAAARSAADQPSCVFVRLRFFVSNSATFVSSPHETPDMTHKHAIALVIISAAVAACTGDTPVKESTAPPAATAATPASPLRTMTARFAPVDIGADIAALPDNERQALARLVEAARIMDGLFLRQVWSGNEAMLETLARQAVTAPERGRRPALLPDQQGPLVAPRSQLAVHSRRAGQARVRQLLPGGRHQGRDPEMDRFAERQRQSRGDRILHDHPARS